MRRVPWMAVAVAVLSLGMWGASFLAPLAELLPACPFKRLTGFPCATCCLTRCVLAAGHGRWAEAFHWYPAAALLIPLPVAALWDLRRAARNEPYPPLPRSRAARAAAWAALLAVWAVQVARNI